MRGFCGRAVGTLGARPEKRLVLYESENCPYSRKVREALSILDLDADIRPCPEGEKKHRTELSAIGGKEQIPLLVDPNTMEVLYEADRIVSYLFRSYGHGKVDLRLKQGFLTMLSSRMASRLRNHAGIRHQPAKRPELPLELWSYESSAGARLVREVLSRFAIPYTLHNSARGSDKLQLLREHVAHTPERVPALYDPNRDVLCIGAGNCVGHVRDTYGKRLASADVVVSDSFDADHAHYLQGNPLAVIP